MPEGIGTFRPKIIGTVDNPVALRARIEHLETHISRLSALLSIQVDEGGGPVGLTTTDGEAPSGGGGGGGGGGDLPAVHTLLDGDRHEDTAEATPVAGDLVYGNASALWDRLPKGTDGTVLVMEAGAPAWGGVSSVVSGSILGVWTREDITNFGAAGDGTELPSAWSKGANDTMSVVIPDGVTGSVTGITLYLDGDVGGVGDDITLTLYKNGSNAGMSLTLSGGAGTEYKAFAATGGPVAVTAGDELTLFGLKSGSVGGRRCVAYVFGILGA